jgi:hypothetical protein
MRKDEEDEGRPGGRTKEDQEHERRLGGDEGRQRG